MKKACLYIVLILMFSCKKEIKVHIEDRPPQLVVNAELNPDSLVLFNLSLTQNITDNKPISYVNGAEILWLEEDTISIVETLGPLPNGDYRSVSKPEPGRKYFFRITALNKVYWIEETMPDTFQSSLIDTGRIVFQGKKNFFQCSLRIEDVGGYNYYGIRMKRVLETYQGADTIFSEEWVPIESKDLVLTENPKTKFSKKNLLFTDEFFAGNSRDFKFGGADLFSTPGQKTRLLVIYTTSYSRNGYNYYTSVNEHLFYQNDPFSQPTLLVGNIPGAFGAAVGKYERTDSIHFK